jgi:hypothetical protein
LLTSSPVITGVPEGSLSFFQKKVSLFAVAFGADRNPNLRMVKVPEQLISPRQGQQISNCLAKSSVMGGLEFIQVDSSPVG